MTLSTTLTAQQGGYFKATLTGAASTANAGLGQFLNPEGVRLVITRAYGYFRTGSTGAANLSCGVGVSGSGATDIISTMDVVEATVGAKAWFFVQVPVNEAEQTVIVEATEYITFTGSASTVGLDGDFYFEYIRLA